MCGGRSGWKSNQADITSRVSGAVQSLDEGEECVNTQTGSVRVAASQSNTVITKDIVGGSSSVNTHTGSVGVAAPLSNTVYVCPNEKNDCLRSGNVRGEQCQVCSVKSNSSGESVCQNVRVVQRGMSPTLYKLGQSRRDIENIVAKPSLEGRAKSTISSTSRLRNYFNNISKKIQNSDHSFEGNMGRGNITPTKRKLIENKYVKNLLPKYSPSRVLPAVSLDESESLGSPAKRSRLE